MAYIWSIVNKKIDLQFWSRFFCHNQVFEQLKRFRDKSLYIRLILEKLLT